MFTHTDTHTHAHAHTHATLTRLAPDFYFRASEILWQIILSSWSGSASLCLNKALIHSDVEGHMCSKVNNNNLSLSIAQIACYLRLKFTSVLIARSTFTNSITIYDLVTRITNGVDRLVIVGVLGCLTGVWGCFLAPTYSSSDFT